MKEQLPDKDIIDTKSVTLYICRKEKIICHIRHGETDWNVEKRIQALESKPCTAIVSSDLKRAHETASIVRNYWLGKEDIDDDRESCSTRDKNTKATSIAHVPKIITDSKLRELHAGDLQGAISTDPKISRIRTLLNGEWKQGKTNRKYPGSGGESLDDLVSRAYQGLKNVISMMIAAKLGGKGGHVFVFSHGGLIKSIAKDIIDKTNKKTMLKPATNCCLSTIKYSMESDSFEIVKMFERVISEDAKDDTG
eukprot:jgi/Bigna1/87481/estExt_fgenesh1_pg.C_200226